MRLFPAEVPGDVSLMTRRAADGETLDRQMEKVAQWIEMRVFVLIGHLACDGAKIVEQ